MKKELFEPVEILVHIFKYVEKDTRTIDSASCISKQFASVINQHFFASKGLKSRLCQFPLRYLEVCDPKYKKQEEIAVKKITDFLRKKNLNELALSDFEDSSKFKLFIEFMKSKYDITFYLPPKFLLLCYLGEEIYIVPRAVKGRRECLFKMSKMVCESISLEESQKIFKASSKTIDLKEALREKEGYMIFRRASNKLRISEFDLKEKINYELNLPKPSSTSCSII